MAPAELELMAYIVYGLHMPRSGQCRAVDPNAAMACIVMAYQVMAYTVMARTLSAGRSSIVTAACMRRAVGRGRACCAEACCTAWTHVGDVTLRRHASYNNVRPSPGNTQAARAHLSNTLRQPVVRNCEKPDGIIGHNYVGP